MISIKNLTKSYNKNRVLNNVNIEFDASINFLIGNNGEGKTTLNNILAGALKPDIGMVLLNNKEISYNDGSYKKNVGFMLSLPTYPVHLKVSEFVDLLNSIYSIDIIKNKVYQEELITFFELNKYLDYKISELSAGYTIRIKLFAAMLHNPNYYIFDEPFIGLDKNFVPQLIEKIIELAIQGKKFLITTHLTNILSFNYSAKQEYKISNGKISKQKETSLLDKEVIADSV